MRGIHTLLKWESEILPIAENHLNKVCQNYVISIKVEKLSKSYLYYFSELNWSEIKLVVEACIWVALVELNEEKRIFYNLPPINFDILDNMLKNRYFQNCIKTDPNIIKKRIETKIRGINALKSSEPLIVFSIYVRGKSFSTRIPSNVKEKVIYDPYIIIDKTGLLKIRNKVIIFILYLMSKKKFSLPPHIENVDLFIVSKKWIINETIVTDLIYNLIIDNIIIDDNLRTRLSSVELEEHKKLITCWWFFYQLIFMQNDEIKKIWQDKIQPILIKIVPIAN